MPQAEAVQPYGPTRRLSRGSSEEKRRVVEAARAHEEELESRMRQEIQEAMRHEVHAFRRSVEEMRQAGEEARSYYEMLAESHVNSAASQSLEFLERAQRAREAESRRAHHWRQAEQG